MKKRTLIILIAAGLAVPLIVAGGFVRSLKTEKSPMDQYDVVWDTPSEDCHGSMPLGNGDIGLNVWAEQDGDLLFYISKNDSWDENCRLLKLGKVRVSLSPNPFAAGQPFEQTLHLNGGEIIFRAGSGEGETTLRVWVDANRPVIRVDVQSAAPSDVKVQLESWRTERRRLDPAELSMSVGPTGHEPPIFVDPDIFVPDQNNRVLWYRRNTDSIWPGNLKLQSLDELIETTTDPLLHRTFGGIMKGEGLVSQGEAVLASAAPGRRFDIDIHVLTSQTETADQWIAQLERQAEQTDSCPREKAREEHDAWWGAFWKRSWIRVENSEKAFEVSQGYALQRFINACASRGQHPVKFNGSIFTVEATYGSGEIETYDADYRMWGGGYWFQNTRLPYWSMVAAGDFDLMQPLFSMYCDMLPLAEFRTKKYYGHDGVFFPETTTFWGTYLDGNYGWDRTNLPLGMTDNQYIRYYWQGGLELSMMMLDAYEHTQDREFAQKQLLPFAHGVVTFFDQHWGRNENGRIHFEPAMALETFWECVNPLVEIVGTTQVIKRLQALPEDLTTPGQRAAWQKTLDDLPPVPIQAKDGTTVLSPAESFAVKANMENPELYAVFPYRMYTVGKSQEMLDLARRTFMYRAHRDTGGWQQNAIQAAMLGEVGPAAGMVIRNFVTKHPQSRFPAFWGPNFDYIPDQTHGGVAMTALQAMLLQSDGQKIYLLPAWPKEWDVEFKLHAPYNTTVEGVYRDGELESLKVTPEARAQDVMMMQPEEGPH